MLEACGWYGFGETKLSSQIDELTSLTDLVLVGGLQYLFRISAIPWGDHRTELGWRSSARP